MRWCPTRRVAAVVAVTLIAASGSGSALAGVTESPLMWSPPVAAPVVAPFVAGSGLFEVGGHAGVDYEPPPGSPVRAAGAGIVAFAGRIGDARFVVVDHGDGLRTTYGQLATSVVVHGARVERGVPLGTAGGSGMRGHGAGRLHFGLRVRGIPHDPLALFAPPDLTALVRLVPSGEVPPQVGPPGTERARAVAWFGESAPPAWLMFGAGGGAGDGGFELGAVLASLGYGASRLVAVGGPGAFVVRHAVGFGSAAVEGVGTWMAAREECSPSPPPSRGFKGTGHHAFVVSGLNSFTRPDGTTNGLPADALGYDADDVSWFSYGPDGGPFPPEATRDGPEAAAGRLAAQLAAYREAHPGRTVDLIGHSQGGVVVEAFLKLHYAGHESRYPPLGAVVTLAAPHRGAPLASLATDLEAVPGIDGFARAIRQPEPGSGAVSQLAEGSEFLERLASLDLPPGVDMTTFGAVGDVLVPAGQTEVRGAEHVVVDPDGWWEHGAIVSDPDALGAVRLALADLPAPCLTLAEALRNEIQPWLVHSALRHAPALVGAAPP